MTVVRLGALETILGAPGPLPAGWVQITYWSGVGPVVRVEGADVVFPSPIRVEIIDGAPARAIELAPTGGVCCVRWVVQAPGVDPLVRFTEIPDVETIDFGELVRVNPATFAPEPVTPTLFESFLMELFGVPKCERVTREEYDALPEPIPADVVYVITN